MNKEELRLYMREKRRALKSWEIESKSAVIEERLFDIKEFLAAKTVMSYISSFKEVSTIAIVNRLFNEKKHVAVPVSNTADETITVSYINSLTELSDGAYGIKEPSVIKECDISDIDVILVPGLAFDIKGSRMGFGKGYYDKLLSKISALKIGLCYDFQLLNNIPNDKHDIPMDIIITEERIITNAF